MFADALLLVVLVAAALFLFWPTPEPPRFVVLLVERDAAAVQPLEAAP